MFSMICSSEGLLKRKPEPSSRLQPKVDDISMQYSGMRFLSPSATPSVNLALGPVTATVQRILSPLSTTGPAIEEKPSWYSFTH